jgi:hypothetical protein
MVPTRARSQKPTPRIFSTSRCGCLSECLPSRRSCGSLRSAAQLGASHEISEVVLAPAIRRTVSAYAIAEPVAPAAGGGHRGQLTVLACTDSPSLKADPHAGVGFFVSVVRGVP